MRERGTEPQKGAQSNEGDKKTLRFPPCKKCVLGPNRQNTKKRNDEAIFHFVQKPSGFILVAGSSNWLMVI